MIRIFRKSWRRSRRTVCAVLCLVFLSSLLAVPVGAAGFDSGTLTFRYVFNDSGTRQLSFNYPYYSNSDGVSFTHGTVYTESSNVINPDSFYFSPGVPLSGTFGIYYSFYFVLPESSSISYDVDFDTPLLVRANIGSGEEAEYIDTSTSSLSDFSVSPVDGASVTKGFLAKIRSNYFDSLARISTLWVYFRTPFRISYISSGSARPLMYSPSCVVISGDANTLDGLESIADGIVAQSEILSAFYGDIMDLLNDLYARLGDMQAVEELTNTYFAQLIPLVNSINTNTANIYSLLQTQFQLLRTLIATESDDIQAAIEQQTEDLKTYFDSVFSGSVGDMPEKSDDLDSAVGDFSSAEQDYQSNATQRFDELASTFSGFSGGTLAGVTLASTLFTRVWDALGQYNIVYYFPLLLGLSLVIIGRLPRGSGGQSSSEKHRGDSSA